MKDFFTANRIAELCLKRCAQEETFGMATEEVYADIIRSSPLVYPAGDSPYLNRRRGPRPFNLLLQRVNIILLDFIVA